MTPGHRGGEEADGHRYGSGHDPEYDRYRAAVDALADPLNDPLPGGRPPEPPRAQPGPERHPHAQPEPPPSGSPGPSGPRAGHEPPQPPPGPQTAAGGPYAADAGQEATWYSAAPYEPYTGAAQPQFPQQSQSPQPPVGQMQSGRRAPTAEPEPRFVRGPVPPAGPENGRYGGGGQPDRDDRSTVGLRQPRAEEFPPRSRTERPPGPTRLEARRAARALRPGPGMIASRAIGEVFITCGVLMLLFVAYQLWWTNVRADQQANGATDKLQQQWDERGSEDGVDPERKAGAFKPGEGFAIIHIPKIDITRPVAQGVSKEKVLDKGMVGHYDKKPLKTAMPWDEKGNFALAGHRNTHGEPFRYINKLQAGDEVVVETRSKYYTYKVTRQLPSTSPSDTGVIDPVPPKSGFSEPGRYITLTTCTPEFTSKYRLIVWGKMVDERPRSKGKPDALVD
ncbi:class E sortase [Streptomyces sp. WMMB303]|uniref:class E sortase n=1 Tax=Streptomyces sp. WMMB303 TaxID=3034154 RepID=UPI0023EA94CC|nr:class E sortase [Streptomyces sp. WMMB303]MDF4251759.1 class E sortase [Streptomyces sp. WMMB303]